MREKEVTTIPGRYGERAPSLPRHAASARVHFISRLRSPLSLSVLFALLHKKKSISVSLSHPSHQWRRREGIVMSGGRATTHFLPTAQKSDLIGQM